jgi:hypothetical protein
MYNKINIVESEDPPTNKNDWWYDLNDDRLKRFSGGKYNFVVGEGSNTPEVSWIPAPGLYKDISPYEFLIFTDDGENTEPSVSLYSDDGHTIEDMQYDAERGAWVITLSTEITTFTEQLFELSITNNSTDMLVAFPMSLNSIDYRGLIVTCNEVPVTLVFPSESFAVADNGIFYDDAAISSSPYLSIITYSHNLIEANIPIVNDYESPAWETPIYVQPSLLKEYGNMPINEMYNIQSIG